MMSALPKKIVRYLIQFLPVTDLLNFSMVNKFFYKCTYYARNLELSKRMKYSPLHMALKYENRKFAKWCVRHHYLIGLGKYIAKYGSRKFLKWMLKSKFTDCLVTSQLLEFSALYGNLQIFRIGYKSGLSADFSKVIQYIVKSDNHEFLEYAHRKEIFQISDQLVLLAAKNRNLFTLQWLEKKCDLTEIFSRYQLDQKTREFLYKFELGDITMSCDFSRNSWSLDILTDTSVWSSDPEPSEYEEVVLKSQDTDFSELYS